MKFSLIIFKYLYRPKFQIKSNQINLFYFINSNVQVPPGLIVPNGPPGSGFPTEFDGVVNWLEWNKIKIKIHF
jgi:hypothetical protein